MRTPASAGWRSPGGAVGDRAWDQVLAGKVVRVERLRRSRCWRRAGRSSPAPSRQTLCRDSPSWPRGWSRRRSAASWRGSAPRAHRRPGVLDPDRAGHDGGRRGCGRPPAPRGKWSLTPASKHQLRRIAGVVGDRLGLDQIAALDPQRRRQRSVEIAPVHRSSASPSGGGGWCSAAGRRVGTRAARLTDEPQIQFLSIRSCRRAGGGFDGADNDAGHAQRRELVPLVEEIGRHRLAIGRPGRRAAARNGRDR